MSGSDLADLVLAVRSASDPSVAALLVLVVVGGLAYHFFSEGAPLKIRVAVFFTVVGFALASVVLAYLPGALQAETGAAPQEAPIEGRQSSALRPFTWFAVVYARDARRVGWIYVGKYDRQHKRWTPAPTNVKVADRRRRRLPQGGDRLTTSRQVDLYDDQPRYTVFGFTWKLGSEIGQVPADTLLTVLDDAVVIGGNVWCRVSIDDD